MSPSSPSISPLRATALLSLAALVAAVAGLLLLELVFGSWLRHNPWERALALNIVTDRRMVFDAAGLYPGGGPVNYSRDRYGLRGSFNTPAEVTVLSIGGSTTDQRYIADGQTWQDVLQTRMRAAGRPATVANAGVDGHSTFAHLAAYRDWLPLIPGLRPRYTLLYVGLNDLFLMRPRLDFEGSTEGQATLKSRIKANSALFRLYAMARGAWAARRLGLDHKPMDFSVQHYTEQGLIADPQALARDSTAAFAKRMADLLARVRAQGSLPICVTQPSLYYRVAATGQVQGLDMPIQFPSIEMPVLNGVDYQRLRQLQDAALAQVCAAAGAGFIDLARMPWEAADFYDPVHNSPQGAQKVGTRIAAGLLALPP